MAENAPVTVKKRELGLFGQALSNSGFFMLDNMAEFQSKESADDAAAGMADAADRYVQSRGGVI